MGHKGEAWVQFIYFLHATWRTRTTGTHFPRFVVLECGARGRDLHLDKGEIDGSYLVHTE